LNPRGLQKKTACVSESSNDSLTPQGSLTAATKQRPARPWGSLPKGCNKMRSYRSATAPGLGIVFIEGSKESLSTRLTRLTRMAGR